VIFRHLDRLGKVHHGRHQVHVGGVGDGRLRLVPDEFDAVRMAERGALHEHGDAPILTMSGCTKRTPAAMRSATPWSVYVCSPAATVMSRAHATSPMART
jgi:hypothetical protein